MKVKKIIFSISLLFIHIDVVGLLPTWNNATSMAVDVLITEK